MGKLAKQSISSTVFIALGFLVGSLANIFIYPKVCSKEELGQFKLFMNWGAIFSQFFAIGVGTLAVRFLPKHRVDKSEGELNYVIFIFPTVALLFFVCFFLLFTNYFFNAITNKLLVSTGFAAFIVITYSVLQTYIKVYSGLSLAMKQSASNFMVNEFLIRLFYLACFVFFYLKFVNYDGLLLILGVSQAVQFILLLYLVKHFVFKTRLTRPKRKALYEKLGYGLYASFDSAANALVGRLDIIMIGVLAIQANQMVQEYDMAFSIATMVFLPFRSMNSSVSPFLSEAFLNNDMNKIEHLYKRTSINLFIVGMLLFTFIYINIDDLIKIIPGDYSSIKLPVFYLCVAKILDMLTSVNNSILLLSPYFRLNLVFNLILVVITIITNWILVPILGIVGSAIATLITIVLYNVIKGGFIYAKYKIAPFHPDTYKAAIGICAIFSAFYFFPSLTGTAIPDMIIRSASCAIVFYIYFVLFKPSDDLDRIRIKTLKRLKLLR